MTNNRPEWIAALKVGDRVVVDRPWIRDGGRYRASVVRKITPSGRIQTDTDTFRPDGQEFGNRGCSFNIAELVQSTPAIERCMAADRARSALAARRWFDLTDEQAIAAAEALNAAGIAGWEA